MTLTEFSNSMFSLPYPSNIHLNCRKLIYVFEHCDDMADFLKDEQATDPMLTLCSPYKDSFYLKPVLANWEIDHFIAIDKNVVAVSLKDFDYKKLNESN